MRASLRGLSLDVTMLGATLGLIVVGFFCLYSVTASAHQAMFSTGFARQIVWFMVGSVAMTAILLFPLNVFYRGAYIFYGISVLLLVLVLFLSTGRVHRWIVVGGFQFQPSELAKVATLLALARYLSGKKEGALDWRRILGVASLALVPALLILKQPDVGTASVFIALLIVMLFWAGIRWEAVLLILLPFVALGAGFHPVSFIGLMILLGVVLAILRPKWWMGMGLVSMCFGLGRLAPSLWHRLPSYQQQRIITFLGMRSDPHGAAYQVIQSKVAIGSGGILGKGFLQGSQTQLRFLPEQHTDFIFSVLGEEFGFLGIIIVLALFLILFKRTLHAATKSTQNGFASFTAIGCLSILAFQCVVNVGMSVGLFPVTGLPMPLLSYGGSCLLMSMILLGLVLNILGRRYTY